MNTGIIKIVLSSSIVGGIIASIPTYIFNYKLKNREARLKLIDKIVEKKIDAYDKIMDLVNITREVSIFDDKKINFKVNFSKYDYPLRYSSILNNYNSFKKYYINFINLMKICDRWVNADIRRELNFLQDYLMNLNELICGLDDYKVRQIGVLIRQDFIDISLNLEKLTFGFYSKQMLELKIEDKSQKHKYAEQVTFERFNKTKLYQYKCEIEKFKNKYEE